MYYTQEQIDHANQADLVSFLHGQGEQLTRAGNEYRWKRHDSLTVRGNKWYRHSQSKGGAPVDFIMEFFGKSFTEAVEMLTGEKGAAPPPDRPSPAPLSDFRLPPRSTDNRIARNYLTAARRIDEDVTGFFFSTGDIYEEAAHHNAVFVGRDESGIPRYAHQRSTAGNFRLDVKGSDKAFNFCYRGAGERLFVFEAPIDLLSFLCLFKKGWQKQSYLSLGGVGEKALLRFLSDRPDIQTVYLCLDSDQAGNDACSRLAELVPEGLTVHRLVPLYKDWNEVLQHRAEIADGKYIREAIYGLKEPPQEETVEIIRMSEVDTQTVEWLWEPYIPFGKVTIVQGNPGEGKTTFALRLAAACTTGGTLPGMKPLPPFQVIYQTAEDGLGDTVKPRLMEAEADLDRVLVIDEAKRELTLSDERIEKAITQNGARLIILDPIQAYMGEKTDMNRANEVRPMFRRLADVAERTGCAVILIGHLNKAAGGQSAYRGLGSIDFRAAARSVLLIGRVKREPNVRVIVHDKSSLAPEGKPIAFCLDPETGFSWISALVFCLYSIAFHICADLAKEGNAFRVCLARIDLTDEAVIYLNFSCVRILVQFIDKDAVDELMDDFIGEFLHVRVLADDLHEAPHIVPALRDGADFLLQPADLLHQGGLLVIIAGYHEGKLLIAETAQGVILIELAEKMVQLAQAGFCLVQLAALFPKRPVGLDVPILGGVGYKLLLMGFHIGEDPLDIAQHQLFQNAFADIVGCADLTGPDAVAVTAAGVSVLAFQCTRALLEIHFVSAVPTEQEAGEQIDLLTFGRAVLRGDPLLRQVKGLLVNQRLMGIGEEVSLIFRVYPRLF